jgi:hypothetical protein
MEAGSLERGGSPDAVVTPQEEARKAAEGEDQAAVGGAVVEAGQPGPGQQPHAAVQDLADSPPRPSRQVLHALTQRVSPRLESEESFMHVSEAAGFRCLEMRRLPAA